MGEVNRHRKERKKWFPYLQWINWDIQQKERGSKRDRQTEKKREEDNWRNSTGQHDQIIINSLVTYINRSIISVICVKGCIRQQTSYDCKVITLKGPNRDNGEHNQDGRSEMQMSKRWDFHIIIYFYIVGMFAVFNIRIYYPVSRI